MPAVDCEFVKHACVCTSIQVCDCGFLWSFLEQRCACRALVFVWAFEECLRERAITNVQHVQVCVQPCLLSIRESLWFVWFIHFPGLSRLKHVCVSSFRQQESLEWLCVFLYIVTKLLSPSPCFPPLCGPHSPSIPLPLHLHLSSLLLSSSLYSLSRWQAVLGHRNRLSSDRCGHLS